MALCTLQAMSRLTGGPGRRFPRTRVRTPGAGGPLFLLAVTALVSAFPAPAHSQQQDGTVAAAPAAPPSTQNHQDDPQATGSVSGTVLDPSGNPLSGAQVKLRRDGQSEELDAVSDDGGRFTFAGVAPGSFQLSTTYSGFTTQSFSGSLHAGEDCVVPQITLAISPEVTAVSVKLTQVEVAEAEIKAEERQFALGFIPNFYVSYVSNAAPLTPRQKFELAWKSTVTPLNFVLTGAFAGIEQARGDYHDYGQGARGYGKRYGAAFGDSVSTTFIGGAILPALFKQDPRYFYKGTGSKKSRVFHALASAVVCRNDNGHLAFDYSGILGSMASGGISTLYYPDRDRGAGLLFEGLGLGVGANAIGNIFEEFIVRKLTPNRALRDPTPRPTPPAK